MSYNNIFLRIFIGKWGHTYKNYGYFMAIYSKKIGVLNKITNIYFKLCYYLRCDLILVCMERVWGRITKGIGLWIKQWLKY